MHPPSTIVCPPSIHNFCGGSLSYPAMNYIALSQNSVLRSQSFQYVLVYNFTTMHAMSHRWDFFACSCRVNSPEPAVCLTVLFPSAVFGVGLHWCVLPMAMSDSKSLNTSLLKVMISSKSERVFMRDLSDLTLQIVFNVWWVSMNVSLEWPSTWNHSRHAPSWRYYLHCCIGDTGSPAIICIIYHQVLRHPSEHGTSSIGKYLLPKAYMTKLNELTESEVTELTSLTVDETALAILKRQGSWGITIVCSLRTTIFKHPGSSILTEMTDNTF